MFYLFKRGTKLYPLKSNSENGITYNTEAITKLNYYQKITVIISKSVQLFAMKQCRFHRKSYSCRETK